MADTDLTLNVGTNGTDKAAADVKKVSDAVDDSATKTSSYSERLQKAALAITTVGVGLTAYSKQATNATVAYDKSLGSIAKVTGETIEQTSRLQYVFERAGIAGAQTSTIFGAFSKQIVATSKAVQDGAASQEDINNKIQAAQIQIKKLTDEENKNGDATGDIKNKIDALNISIRGYQKQLSDATTPLQRLGVATVDATGKQRGFSDILLDVADKFKDMPNGAQKTTDALELFGKAGKSLLPILSQGSDGIEALEKQADKLGFTLTEKNYAAVLKYSAAQKKLQDQQKALTLEVGTAAIPMWERLATAQGKVGDLFTSLPTGVQHATASFLALSGPVLTAGGSLLGLSANISTAAGGKGIGELAGKLPILGNAAKAMGGSFAALGGILGGWTGVVLLAVAAIALLAIKFDLVNKGLNLMKPALDDAKKVIDDLTQVAQHLADIFTNQLSKAWDVFTNAIMKAVGIVAPYKKQLEDLAIVVGVTFLVALGLVVIAIGVVVAAFAGVIAIGARVAAFFVDMGVTVAGFAVTMTDAVVKAIVWVATHLGELPGIVGDALKGAGTWLYDSGKAIISGLIDGIESMISKAGDAVKKVLSKIANFFPHSPAKEGPFSGRGWTLYSGQAISEGLAQGIESRQSRAVSAISSVMNAVSGVGIDTPAGTITVGGNSNSTSGFSSSQAATLPAYVSSQPSSGVNISLNVNGNVVGGNSAATRDLAVQFAQMVNQAMKGQGTDDVTQLRTAAV